MFSAGPSDCCPASSGLDSYLAMKAIKISDGAKRMGLSARGVLVRARLNSAWEKMVERQNNKMMKG